MPDRMHHFLQETKLDYPIEEVFAFFSDARNLQAITPPWLNFRIVTPMPIDFAVATRVEYKLQLYGFPLRWVTRIEVWNPPHEFVDSQLQGPYRGWRHLHQFIDEGGTTRMLDQVDYQLPFGFLGKIVERLWVGRDVQRIFAHRTQVIREKFPEKRGLR